MSLQEEEEGLDTYDQISLHTDFLNFNLTISFIKKKWRGIKKGFLQRLRIIF
jgi:hypothetical protein